MDQPHCEVHTREIWRQKYCKQTTTQLPTDQDNMYFQAELNSEPFKC